MIKKVKAWIESTGISNLFYVGIFLYALVKGFSGIDLYSLVAGASAGIFIYINFNVIKKLIEDKV